VLHGQKIRRRMPSKAAATCNLFACRTYTRTVPFSPKSLSWKCFPETVSLVPTLCSFNKHQTFQVIDSPCSSYRDLKTYLLLKFLTGVYSWRKLECDKCINLCLWNSVSFKRGKGIFIFQDPHATIVQNVQNLLESNPRKTAVVIKSKGGPTPTC
jgi:hypothetical protein